MGSFNVIALDEDFEILALLRYTNIQWSRKYFECGTFSVQIPLEQYDSRIKYIYTKDRPEMGKVTQINYVNNQQYKYVALSGYFLENELNRMVVYPKQNNGNITSDPGWVEGIDKAEDLAFTFFNAFKSITFTQNGSSVTFDCGVVAGTSQGRGNTSDHLREGEYLGDQIYKILKNSGLSYRVDYDFDTSKKTFEVWEGKNRTEEQTVNNPVTFSTRYGNIREPDVLIDNTAWKTGCIGCNSVSNNGSTTNYNHVIINPTDEANMNSFLFLKSAVRLEDYSSTSAFYDAMDAESLKELEGFVQTINVTFDSMEGSYEYMTDFDLGDVCNLEITEINISAEARLIGCYEVVKDGVWTMTMEFGTPILKKR